MPLFFFFFPHWMFRKWNCSCCLILHFQRSVLMTAVPAVGLSSLLLSVTLLCYQDCLLFFVLSYLIIWFIPSSFIFWGESWWSPGWMINMGLIERCLAVFFVVFCFIAAVHFSSFHPLCATPPPPRTCLSIILTFTLSLPVPVSLSALRFHHCSVFLLRWVLIAHIFCLSRFFLRLLSLVLSHIVPSLVPSSGPNQTTHHSQNSDFSQGHSTSSKTKKWIVSQCIATYTVANDFILITPRSPLSLPVSRISFKRTKNLSWLSCSMWFLFWHN